MPIVIANPDPAIVGFTDDFSSYSIGTFPQVGDPYTVQHIGGVGGTTFDIVSGAKISAVAGGTGAAGDESSLLFLGAEYTDFTTRLKVTLVSGGGTGNYQPGVLGRYTDGSNLMGVKLNKFNNDLKIADVSGGSATVATTAYTWAFDTPYYLELVVNGSSAIATVYSDAGYSTVLVTVSKTLNHLSAGKIGPFSSGDQSIAEFDDFVIVPG